METTVIVPNANSYFQQVAAAHAELSNLPKEIERRQRQKLIRNQNKIIKLLEDQAENGVQRPDYLNYLIKEGYVHIDGVTATVGLEKIADCLLNTLGLDFVTPELLMQFRQKNGKLFKITSAREAVKRVKVKNEETD